MTAHEFLAVEEHLGRGSNTQAYYDILGEVGGPTYDPTRDALPWVRHMLQAHCVQAQVVERRVAEASELWLRLHALRKEAGLLERTAAALAIAASGLAVTNASYRVAVDAEGGPGSEALKPVTASATSAPWSPPAC